MPRALCLALPPPSMLFPPPVNVPVFSQGRVGSYKPALPAKALHIHKALAHCPQSRTGLPTPSTSFPPATAFATIGYPHTPPLGSFTPPWTEHDHFLRQQDLPLSPAGTIGVGSVAHGSPSPRHMTEHSRQWSNSSRTSLSSLKAGTHTRHRTWSVTVDEIPGGGIKATGLMADDGTYILHGDYFRSTVGRADSYGQVLANISGPPR